MGKRGFACWTCAGFAGGRLMCARLSAVSAEISKKTGGILGDLHGLAEFSQLRANIGPRVLTFFRSSL